ncbi:phage holin family protein [Sphingomonas sp.]|uniref:phage holin family protein n=1 Tax=Sphingomonas sp. TaxID=28214 RepID=UPI001B022603|nr:phage holin family protein [Sphingomonas sp.]MBO9715149.1 phage holin family protein [Sphingomonas sp.]
MADKGPDEESIGDLLARLAEDARRFGQAELDYYRVLAAEKLEEAKASLWIGAVAIGLMLAAAVALVFGLVLTLAQYVGPALATLIVVALAVGTAWLLGRIAWRHIKRVVGLRK